MRLIVCTLLLSTSIAQAHTQLRYPPARTAAQKAGPCGAAGSTRGTQVTTFQPGETITVEWDETVDHPGHFRIALDDDGDDDLPNPNNPGDNFPATLVEPIADKAGGHYTQQVTLPMTTCTNCTLQLVQVMTTAVPYNSFYYQCADIVIGDGGGGGGGGDGTDGGCSTGTATGGGATLLVLAVLGGRRRSRRRQEARRRQ